MFEEPAVAIAISDRQRVMVPRTRNARSRKPIVEVPPIS
jgi:hypothetical protein